ncbi:MAG: hypothetical protein J0H78_02295 [Rhizobiales bacterium]|nr:hypothetical protein [Hyphomicrobiales bacterium]OJY43167.1 MAG: hypothetical protein BGP08_21100 [Rhizobiales bacterium 64-17]
MKTLSDEEQGRIWSDLYHGAQKILHRRGRENAFGRGDYWILEDNYGPLQHKIYINNLRMIDPGIVHALQKLLTPYPDWSWVIAIDLSTAGKSWPEMGLIVRKHEIVDGLKRELFPKEFRSLQYEGARPGTDRD